MATEHEQWVLERFGREVLWRRVWIAAGLVLASLILLGPRVLPYLLMDQKDDVSSSRGLEAVRLIRSRAALYAAKYNNGFPPSLDNLGPAAGSNMPSCDGADLLEDSLAGGQARGYRFEYRPGPRHAKAAPGCKSSGAQNFTLHARPVLRDRASSWSFYVDETGLIHFTEEDRPATASDPIIR